MDTHQFKEVCKRYGKLIEDKDEYAHCLIDNVHLMFQQHYVIHGKLNIKVGNLSMHYKEPRMDEELGKLRIREAL